MSRVTSAVPPRLSGSWSEPCRRTDVVRVLLAKKSKNDEVRNTKHTEAAATVQ